MSLDTRSFRERLEEGTYVDRARAEGAVRRSLMSLAQKKTCLAAVADYYADEEPPPARKFPPPPSQPLLPPASPNRAGRILDARKVAPPPAPSAARLEGLAKARHVLAMKRAEAKEPGPKPRATPQRPTLHTNGGAPLSPEERADVAAMVHETLLKAATPTPELVSQSPAAVAPSRADELAALERATAMVLQLLEALSQAFGKDVAASAAWVEAVAAAGRLAVRASELAGCGPVYEAKELPKREARAEERPS